ncbi:MAG TPA: hypothetical protein PKD00_05745 [Burkholderiales bacterium]|nr:hypothetical protein [Burkholderiales bacterium]
MENFKSVKNYLHTHESTKYLTWEENKQNAFLSIYNYINKKLRALNRDNKNDTSEDRNKKNLNQEKAKYTLIYTLDELQKLFNQGKSKTLPKFNDLSPTIKKKLNEEIYNDLTANSIINNCLSKNLLTNLKIIVTHKNTDGFRNNSNTKTRWFCSFSPKYNIPTHTHKRIKELINTPYKSFSLKSGKKLNYTIVAKRKNGIPIEGHIERHEKNHSFLKDTIKFYKNNNSYHFTRTVVLDNKTTYRYLFISENFIEDLDLITGTLEKIENSSSHNKNKILLKIKNEQFKYKGEFKDKNQMEGYGKIFWKDTQHTYIGEFKNNVPCGFGILYKEDRKFKVKFNNEGVVSEEKEIPQRDKLNDLKGGVNKKVYNSVLFAINSKGSQDFIVEKGLNNYIKLNELNSKRYLSLQYPLPTYKEFLNKSIKNSNQKQCYIKFLMRKVTKLKNKNKLNDSTHNIETILNLLDIDNNIDLEKIQVALILDYDKNNISLYSFIKNQAKKQIENRDKQTICFIIEQIFLAIEQFYNDKILHQDGHTKNIILTKNNQIKYIDFGKGKFNNAVTNKNNFNDILYLFDKKSTSSLETLKRNSFRNANDEKQEKHYPLHKLIGLLSNNTDLINTSLQSLGNKLIRKLQRIDQNSKNPSQEKANAFRKIRLRLLRFCSNLQ